MDLKLEVANLKSNLEKKTSQNEAFEKESSSREEELYEALKKANIEQEKNIDVIKSLKTEKVSLALITMH